MRTSDPISYTDEQLRQTIARLEITIPRDQSILAHARRQLRKREPQQRPAATQSGCFDGMDNDIPF